MSEPIINKIAFIERYVKSAKAAGFDITATEDGCHYAYDPEDDFGPMQMFAAPCDCGCVEGWAMQEEKPAHQ